MRRLATVCARGGSKGVPGKNLRSVAGKPLLAWTVDLALACGAFDTVVVDSDDEDVLELAALLGVPHCVHRPAPLASDTSSKLPAIAHAVREAERREGCIAEAIVDLDVTSPLRITDDVDGALRLFESGVGNVITGCVARRSPYFNLVERSEGGVVGPVVQLDPPPQRRQDVPMCFDMNASIYVWERDRFLAQPYVFDAHTRLYEMPVERSIDIDDEFDLLLVDRLLRDRL